MSSKQNMPWFIEHKEFHPVDWNQGQLLNLTLHTTWMSGERKAVLLYIVNTEKTS